MKVFGSPALLEEVKWEFSSEITEAFAKQSR